MKKVAIVGCGAYMDSGYGCPGEWRCLKAAALGEGRFDEPSQVTAFVKCECPGRTLATNMGMAMKLSEIKPRRDPPEFLSRQCKTGVSLWHRRRICPNP